MYKYKLYNIVFIVKEKLAHVQHSSSFNALDAVSKTFDWFTEKKAAAAIAASQSISTHPLLA